MTNFCSVLWNWANWRSLYVVLKNKKNVHLVFNSPRSIRKYLTAKWNVDQQTQN